MKLRTIILPTILAFASLALTVTFIGAAFYQRAADREALESDLALYDRFRSIAAFAPKLSSLSERQPTELYRQFFTDGGTGSEASANLTRIVNEMAQAAGVQVLQSSEVTPKDQKDLLLAAAELELSGRPDAVYSVLQQIETAKPFIVIDKVSLRTSGFVPEANEEAPVSVLLGLSVARREVGTVEGQADP
jgi:hypothetical protein